MTHGNFAPEIIHLTASDAHVLDTVAPGVFDGPIDTRLTREFLTDRRHHIFVARENEIVVGMVTAVDYVHPDKAPILWINEIGVAPSHRQRGIGKRLLETMLAHGRAIGCTEAWLGTEEHNVAARRLYESAHGEVAMFALYTFHLVPQVVGAGAVDSSGGT